MNQKNGKAARMIVRAVAVLAALAVIVGSIFFLFAPGSAGAESFKTLKKGDSGKEIRAAQEALKKLGYYDGKEDGNFSKTLEAAVLNFQKDFGLKETGKLDEETYLFILSDEGGSIPDDPSAASPDATAPPAEGKEQKEEPFVVGSKSYSDKEHVAAYIRQFGHLPNNYVTKKLAQQYGWSSVKANLWEIAPGKSIGGDRFGNYEGLLPEAKGRVYYECDIDFDGYYRNGKRIVYSNDGLIFYTGDHYKTFEEMK